MYQSRFIAPFMQWFTASTDAPFAFGEASALMCLSTVALGRRWLASGHKLNANLYVMLVGPSSRARKSTTIRHAQEIIEIVNPARIGPTDYTAEGLFKWMSEKDEATGKSRSRLTLFASEFAADLARSAQYKNSFRDDLTNLYDGFDLQKVRSGFGKNVNIVAPRVSLFGAITYESLRASATSMDWQTGFMTRFLYVTPVEWRELRILEADPNPDGRDFVASCLQLIKDTIQQNIGPLRMTPEAKQIYAEEYSAHLTSFANGKVDPDRELPAEIYMQRFWPNIRKVSLLHQLDIDPQQDIGAEAMYRAIRFARNCWAGYVKAHRETTIGDFGTLCHAVMDVIKKSAGGVHMRTLSSIFGHSTQLGVVLKYVESTNLVRRIQTPDGAVTLVVR